MIHDTEHDIIRLPTERPTTGHLRMYLSDLAMQFHNLSMAALNGDYHTGNSDFFEVKNEKASVRSRERAEFMLSLLGGSSLRYAVLSGSRQLSANFYHWFRPTALGFERTSTV